MGPMRTYGVILTRYPEVACTLSGARESSDRARVRHPSDTFVDKAQPMRVRLSTSFVSDGKMFGFLVRPVC